MSLKETYIQYGVPNSWAQEYEHKGISVATFIHTTKKNLLNKYHIPIDQITFVKRCLTRQPIDEDIVQKLLIKSNFLCCLCKEDKSKGFIIHHIIEYSKSKDNSYDNLAVLCLEHHDLAHREGISLTTKISEKQIRKAKNEWETQVKIENKKKALIKPSKEKGKNWKKSNPYKELHSYTESDKEYFFGRNEEIIELLERINKYNIVGLFGESGTGKTSLVNAGLIPNLKKEGFITISVRCLDEPIKRIREELYKIFRENKSFSDIIEELVTIDTFPHLIIKLNSIVEKEGSTLIIIIDQFEEIFTRAREAEREQLSKGIVETLSFVNGKIKFLFSLREDFIGELWDWAHLYRLEDAWIRQYRISRLNEKKAFEVIVKPLKILGIKISEDFVNKLIIELKVIGDGLIYPPYLQIVCSKLFDEYKNQNSSLKPSLVYDNHLINVTDSVESIIADYLSDSMLEDLTQEEKIFAQNILDLLTGSEGLRAFLNTEEICKYLKISETNVQHVLEHLIKKKIVHPVVVNDNAMGFELVHDFLSKKFFEKLGPEARQAKTTIEIFRKAFNEWKQHGVLASKDRLELLFPNIKQLVLNEEEWIFLMKSSFSVYWFYENIWTTSIEKELLNKICISFLYDKDEKIFENSIRILGESKKNEMIPLFIEIVESNKSSINVKDVVIYEFAIHIVDIKVLIVLKNIIKNERSYKLRKAAIYAFGKNLNELSKKDKNLLNSEIHILFEALNDSTTQVRKEVADVLSYVLVDERSVKPLIERLNKEISVSSRKAVVSALSSLLKKGHAIELITPILRKISVNEREDYRVREEAKYGLSK